MVPSELFFGWWIRTAQFQVSFLASEQRILVRYELLRLDHLQSSPAIVVFAATQTSRERNHGFKPRRLVAVCERLQTSFKASASLRIHNLGVDFGHVNIVWQEVALKDKAAEENTLTSIEMNPNNIRKSRHALLKISEVEGGIPAKEEGTTEREVPYPMYYLNEVDSHQYSFIWLKIDGNDMSTMNSSQKEYHWECKKFARSLHMLVLYLNYARH